MCFQKAHCGSLRFDPFASFHGLFHRCCPSSRGARRCPSVRPCLDLAVPPTDLPSMDRGSTQSFLHAIPPLSVGWRAARSMGCSRACCAGAPVPSVRANAQFIHCAIGRNSFHLQQNVSPLPSKSALHAKSSDSNLAPNLSNSVECIPAWLRLKGFPML